MMKIKPKKLNYMMTNKIYEELNEGKYQLSFTILIKDFEDSFRCKIKYYKEDIEILEKENMETLTNFPK